MELRVLGPLEVVGADGPVVLTASKHRRLLTALALHAGEVRSREVLVECVWGDAPPQSAQKLLQVYVSQLRKVLPTGVRIRTQGDGYALDLDEGVLDAARMESLLADARRARQEGNPALAMSLLDGALRLWRGPAYADLRDDVVAQAEIGRLEEQRLAALEQRIDAQLELGRHAEVLGELQHLVRTQPLREHLRAQAMLALYRSGRQSEALALYAETHAQMDEELGLEPGTELRELQRRILVQDPALEVATEIPRLPPDLPEPPNKLVGRVRELDELRAILARRETRLLVLTGAGGCGKTRLALEAARQNAVRYANGAAVVELASIRTPDLVLPTIARALGVRQGSEDLMEAVVDGVRRLEMLVVVDNAEHLPAAAPVYVELLARLPRLTVMITSRAVLHLSGEQVFPVTPLTDDAGVTLFAERARALVPTFAMSPAVEADVRRICRRLDGLPLAIELAAGRITTLSPSGLLARLNARLTLLTGGPVDLPARQQTLRETLDWSATLLDDGALRSLARLSVLPGGATAETAWAVCGADLDILTVLVDHNLLQRIDFDGDPRFQLLETVREYAWELLGADRDDALLARSVHLCELVETTPLRGREQQQGLARIDAELDNIRDALDHAVAVGDVVHEMRLTAAMWRYWWIRGHIHEGRVRLEAALEHTEHAPPRLVASVLNGAAGLAWSTGDHARARDLAERHLTIARAEALLDDELRAHNVLGVIALNERRFREATSHLERSLELATHLGSEIDMITAQMNLGVTAMDSGALDRAEQIFEEVLAHHRREHRVEGEGFALLNLGEIAYKRRHAAIARDRFEEARRAFAVIGFRAHVGHAIQGRAAVEAMAGEFELAAGFLGMAEVHLADAGANDDGFNPTMVAQAAAGARAALGDAVFAAAVRRGRAEAAGTAPAGVASVPWTARRSRGG